MLNRLFLAAAYIALTLFISCSDDDNPISEGKPTVTGSGNLITESRTLPSFSSISMMSVGDVVLRLGATQAVSVTVDDNIMALITTDVDGGVLSISSDPTKQLDSIHLTLNLTITGLQSVTLAGVGSITSSNDIMVANEVELLLSGEGDIVLPLYVLKVTATMSGAGSIELSGASELYSGVMSGVGDLKSFALETDTTSVTLSGVGQVEVNCLDDLTVLISGEGNVYYTGQPTIHQTITGQGQVVDAN